MKPVTLDEITLTMKRIITPDKTTATARLTTEALTTVLTVTPAKVPACTILDTLPTLLPIRCIEMIGGLV